MSEPEYQNRTVAFIDILGFSQLINDDKVSLIKNALDECASVIDEIADKPSILGLRSAQFSDSIIISAQLGAIPVNTIMANVYVVDFVRTLALKLLNFGVLCRGGVTTGKLYHDERHCFGPALLRAHELESKVAVYPRIVIDERIYRQTGPFLPQGIFRSNDGLLILDIFKREALIKLFGNAPHETMSRFKKIIEDMQSSNNGDLRTMAKIDWAITNVNWAKTRMES
jgi:hypothetical protein